MDSAALIDSLQRAVPGVPVESAPSIDGHIVISVPPDAVPAIARALHDAPDLAFVFLAELTAVDFWPAEPRYEVVYILVSFAHRARLRMIVRLNAGGSMKSVIGVWPAANWLEREVWDLFGIEFVGHPDPRRLLMPEDWDGFPLRKDYPVQIRKRPTYAEPLQVTEEEFRRNVEKDRLARR